MTRLPFLSSRQRGFTLLEVLVALAVFAVAAVALLRVGESQLTLSRQLEEKTFAHWVAMNQITEMQARQAWPDMGETKSRTTMAGRDWSLTVNTVGTVVNSMRRIDVTVSLAGADGGKDSPVVTQLSGFLDQPRTPTTGTTQ